MSGEETLRGLCHRNQGDKLFQGVCGQLLNSAEGDREQIMKYGNREIIGGDEGIDRG